MTSTEVHDCNNSTCSLKCTYSQNKDAQRVNPYVALSSPLPSPMFPLLILNQCGNKASLIPEYIFCSRFIMYTSYHNFECLFYVRMGCVSAAIISFLLFLLSLHLVGVTNNLC